MVFSIILLNNFLRYGNLYFEVDKMTVGEHIREIRKQRGMTQAQLAEKSGVAAISIHQYETGKRNPQLAQLIRIAAVLGFDWNSIVTEEERRRIVMGRNSETSKTSGVGVVVGGKIIAPDGIKTKYGVYAGGGIEAGGPVEIGLVVQKEMARANKAMEQMTEDGRKRVADYAEDILPRYRREEAPEPEPPTPDTPMPSDAPEEPETGK